MFEFGSMFGGLPVGGGPVVASKEARFVSEPLGTEVYAVLSISMKIHKNLKKTNTFRVRRFEKKKVSKQV